MQCEICGKGPADGATIHRQNPKGEKGIWRCDQYAVGVSTKQRQMTAEIERSLNGGNDS